MPAHTAQREPSHWALYKRMQRALGAARGGAGRQDSNLYGSSGAQKNLKLAETGLEDYRRAPQDDVNRFQQGDRTISEDGSGRGSVRSEEGAAAIIRSIGVYSHP